MADLDRNKNLTWFAKVNHGKVGKTEVCKLVMLSATVSRLQALGFTITGDGATPLAGNLETEGDASGDLLLEGDASGSLELEGTG